MALTTSDDFCSLRYIETLTCYFCFISPRVEKILQKYSRPVRDAQSSHKRRKRRKLETTISSNNTAPDNAHVQYIRSYREGQRAILRELLDELEGTLENAEGDQESGEEHDGEEEEEGESCEENEC